DTPERRRVHRGVLRPWPRRRNGGGGCGVDAPDAAPRAGDSSWTGQALLLGLRRLPRPRGSCAAVHHFARRRGARDAAHERLPARARAEHGRDSRASSAGQVLRRARRGAAMTAGSSASKLERVLDPNAIVVFDGAMGTMLYSKGVFINQCYDELNVRAPELVRDVHAQYVNAGADVIETNSFGANRVKLTQYGLQDQVHELNRAAAAVA